MSFNEWLFFIRQKFSERISELNPINLFNQVSLDIVFEGVFHQSLTTLLPIIGYGLFIASIGDYIYLIFPLQLRNPTWELQTLGALVEQSWGFLISLALIFSRYFLDNQGEIRFIDLLALKLIRWLVLVMAIIFIICTPLIVFDTYRLYKSINQQVSREDQVRLAQLAEINTKIGEVSDLNQIINLGNALGLNLNNSQNNSVANSRNIIKERLETLNNEIERRIANNRKTQTQQLLKSSFRTLYAGLIVSIIFIIIWFKIGTIRHLL